MLGLCAALHHQPEHTNESGAVEHRESSCYRCLSVSSWSVIKTTERFSLYPDQNSMLFGEPASRLSKGVWASLRRQIRMFLCLLSFLKYHTRCEAAVWGGGSSCGRSPAVKTHLNLVMSTAFKVWLQRASSKQLTSAWVHLNCILAINSRGNKSI